MKVRRWKQWWQVLSKEGFTVAQFLSEREARAYAASGISLPAAENFAFLLVSNTRGHVMRRINKYP